MSFIWFYRNFRYFEIIAYLLWKKKLIETQIEINEIPKWSQKLDRMYSHRNVLLWSPSLYQSPEYPLIPI
jgi:hypothetical protein